MTDFKKEYVDLLWLGMEGSSQCTTIKHISRIEMFVSLICVCFGFCFCGFPSGVFSCLVAKSKFYDCASVSFFFVEWHIKLLFLLREWLLAKATNTLFLILRRFLWILILRWFLFYNLFFTAADYIWRVRGWGWRDKVISIRCLSLM